MTTAKQLVEVITQGIQEKKGQEIVIVDMQEIDGAICNYFVICTGNSPTQVSAIMDSVEDMARDKAGEKPIRGRAAGSVDCDGLCGRNGAYFPA